MRWGLVAVVLLAAAVVAVWPREPVAGPAPTVSTDLTDLTALRARAALDPCPVAAAAAVATGVLATVSVPCLGSAVTVPLGAALAGRETLLNVWSHTCQPCRDELPVLQDYAARPDAVDVLAVQVDGSPQAGLGLLTALGVRLPSVADPDGVLRAALGAPAVLPLSYLVGADGSVRMVNPPVVFDTADEVAEVVGRYRATRDGQ